MSDDAGTGTGADHPAIRLWAQFRDFSVLNWIAAALLVFGFAIGAWETYAAASTRHIVADQNEARAAGQGLLSTLKDLETGERGYALTGVETYLQPYTLALGRIDKSLADIERHGAPPGLAGLVQAKREAAAQVVAARRQFGLDAATNLILTGDDKSSMDAARSAIADLTLHAQTTIARATASEDARGPIRIALASASILAAFAAIAWLALRRRRAEKLTAGLLSSVLDNAPLGLGFLDPDLRIRHANRALSSMAERVKRARMAAPPRARVTTGRMALRQPSWPPDGSQRSWTAKSSTSTRPSTKDGTVNPAVATAMTARSMIVLRWSAA